MKKSKKIHKKFAFTTVHLIVFISVPLLFVIGLFVYFQKYAANRYSFATSHCRIKPACLTTSPICKIPTPQQGWCQSMPLSQNGQLQANTPIDHVVVIMMENHTFDSMFGQFPGVNGATLSAASNPPRSDLDHQDQAYQAALDGGKMDEFNNAGQVQYSQSDIPIYWNYAQQFGLGDNFFSANPTSSTPNHVSMIASQTGGDDDANPDQGCGSPNNWLVYSKDTTGKHYWSYPCYDIPSLPQVMSSIGLSWKYYDDPNITTWDAPLLIKNLYNSPNDIHSTSQFVQDVQSGNMATVSWINPSKINSDHPSLAFPPGENYVSNIVNTIMQSQYWPNTAIFLSWDDWGGFYDHVQPPLVNGDSMGARVPLIVMSPYTPQGYVSHGLSEFSSFNKFIEDNWNIPNLGARDANPNITDLMDYFNFNQATQAAYLQNPLPYTGTLVIPNNDPKLGGSHLTGAINPHAGTTNTTFTYSVKYMLPNPPAIHNITIDGNNTFAMLDAGKAKDGGELYDYTTNLGLGHHTFTYTFTDVNNTTITLPYSTTPFAGPDVYPFNISMSFSPSQTVLAGQPVTYKATYTSPTGKAPIRTELDIDGQAVQMVAGGNNKFNYKTGVIYKYTTTSLTAGEHYYRTIFDDGSGPVTYEGAEEPVITNFTLTNSSVSPTSGNSQTPFIFKTTYTHAQGIAPTRAEVDVDNKPYPMTLISGSPSTGALYQATTTLPKGNHTYVFIFGDGQTTWDDPYYEGVYNGPSVSSATSLQTGSISVPSHDYNPDYPFNFSDAADQ